MSKMTNQQQEALLASALLRSARRWQKLKDKYEREIFNTKHDPSGLETYNSIIRSENMQYYIEFLEDRIKSNLESYNIVRKNLHFEGGDIKVITNIE